MLKYIYPILIVAIYHYGVIGNDWMADHAEEWFKGKYEELQRDRELRLQLNQALT